MSQGPLHEKTLDFAVRIVNFCKYLRKKKESVMSRQVLRSGTAVGALLREATHGESAADFVHKLSIALKEAHETEYWIELLYRTEYIDKTMYESLTADCKVIIAMLVKSIKTKKENAKR
jgi:four helix bundle protein